MNAIVLLCLITVGYASYNLLVKVSSNYAGTSTSPILATIALQVAALSVSIVYLVYLGRQSVSLSLPGKAYLWAIAGGLCIGLAEIMYFYLFRGVAGGKATEASVAVPFVVGGTIVIAVAVSHFIFRESLGTGQWVGVALAFVGMVVLAVNSGS